LIYLFTANARALGSKQAQQIQAHAHAFNYSNKAPISGNQAVLDGAGSLGFSTTNAGGSETRPLNTAYFPRIHA
jgi:hypothetical protein